jgi:hypothetical protein
MLRVLMSISSNWTAYFQSTYYSRLCAGKRWRENGETSADYLKRTIEARQLKDRYLLFNILIQIHFIKLHQPWMMLSLHFIAHYILHLLSMRILFNSLHQQFLTIIVYLRILNHHWQSRSLGLPDAYIKVSQVMDDLPYEILALLFDHRETALLAVNVFNAFAR